MNFKVEKHGDIALVAVALHKSYPEWVGRICKKILLTQIEGGIKKLIVDLSQCEFIDSTFLGALVVTLKKITQQSGDLKLVGFQPAVQSMFELTRMYRIFEAFTNKNEAINSFK